MPTDPQVLGFSNRWYKSGFANAELVHIDGLHLKVLRFPDFLATKLETFNQRGKRDFFASKDFEDIITVLAGRPGFLGEILKEHGEQIDYIREQFKNFLADPDFRQSVGGHVPHDQSRKQVTFRILSDLKELVGEV